MTWNGARVDTIASHRKAPRMPANLGSRIASPRSRFSPHEPPFARIAREEKVLKRPCRADRRDRTQYTHADRECSCCLAVLAMTEQFHKLTGESGKSTTALRASLNFCVAMFVLYLHVSTLVANDCQFRSKSSHKLCNPRAGSTADSHMALSCTR